MCGADVNVIFTGSRYLFFSGWYGLFCVAERVQAVEDNDITKGAFVLYVEENGDRGGAWRDFVTVAKKVINKSENKYISREVSYTVEFANVGRWVADIKVLKF